MIAPQLREARDAVPFRPFTIHLTDGRSYRVAHRDFLLITTSGRVAVVHQPTTDALDLLDVMLISSLAIDPSSPPIPSAAETNGA
jgi:hypothetical protein